MTLKQRRLMKGIAQGKSTAEAARAAGYSEGSARGGIRDLLRTSRPLRYALARQLERAGLTDADMARHVKAGVEAMETKFFQDKGVVTDSREVIAWTPRLAALEMAYRIKGYLGRESADASDPSTGPSVSITFHGPIAAEGYRATLEARETATRRVMATDEPAGNFQQPPTPGSDEEPAQRVMDEPDASAPQVPAKTGQRTAASDKDHSVASRQRPRRKPSTSPSAHDKSMAEVEAFLAAEAAAGRA